MLGNVPISIAVTAGNGTLTGVASRTVSGGPTTVGTWTLGQKVGVNQLTVTVGSLLSLVIDATANAGAAAKLAPLTPAVISGRVGDPATPAPSARLTDAFDNPITGANVSVALSGGGTAPTTVVSDASGVVTLSAWTFSTIAGKNVLTLADGAATTSFTANLAPSDPAQIVAQSGDQQHALAGAPLPAPLVIRVADKYGNTVPAQTVAVSVTRGGGSFASGTASSAVSNATDGSITLPAWTLGRSALPQTVHVTSGSLAADFSATVQTDYHIDVRFFGPPMTAAQQALFTNAAARLSAIVIGDVPDLSVTGLSVSAVCGVSGLPVLTETIDDVIIYASVQDIDGAGKILAQAGPCYQRNASNGYLTAVGVMEFDSADLAALDANGELQDVITHEMLHVLGVGTLWNSDGLLQFGGTVNSTYAGVAGRQGCVAAGGAAVCAGGVPVENNGVRGTADAHWRETTFRSELMTGYVNAGGMPLSAITVGSLADLGYVVNPLAADPYLVPTASAALDAIPVVEPGWERPLPGPGPARPSIPGTMKRP